MKSFLILIFLLLNGISFSQGTPCSSAFIPLSADGTCTMDTPFTMVAATSPTSACLTNNSDGQGYWFNTVVSSSGDTWFDMSDASFNNTDFDGIISIFSGTCSSLTEITCDDNSGQGIMPQIISENRTPGEPIWIFVWEKGNVLHANREFNICRYGPGVLNVVLPITLTKFTAELEKERNRVNINWTTLSEINNDYFTLEKSKNGLNWTEIYRTNGAGNSNSQLDYTYFDNSPYLGISYYRLKQTDFDGLFAYSGIRLIVNDESDFSIFPTITDNEITIRKKKIGINDFQIFNMLGQNLTELVSASQNNNKSLILNVSNLTQGNYIIKVGLKTEKFVKL